MSIRNSREWSWTPINSVKPYARCMRQHDRRKIDKLKRQIGNFGQVAPIIVDAENTIVDGHAVWRAMRELGADEIAVVTIAGRTDPEIRALRLALNRLPREVAWNNKELRTEFTELLNFNVELLEFTGFDTAEIDYLLELDLPSCISAGDGQNFPAPETIAVTRPGDIWRCGRHRLGCGSALDREFLQRVRAGALADVCFIDPTRLLAVDARASGASQFGYSGLACSTGEPPSLAFLEFLAAALNVLQSTCTPDALIYACADWSCVHQLLDAGRKCSLGLSQVCVLTKPDVTVGSIYSNQHELICVFQAGSELPDKKAGTRKRQRSNVWAHRDFDPHADFSSNGKPVDVVADVLRDVTNRGGRVADTFLGSGSTLMAAEETGRSCIGIDIVPHCLDISIRRWQAETTLDAVHASTGESFNERTRRLSAPVSEDVHG